MEPQGLSPPPSPVPSPSTEPSYLGTAAGSGSRRHWNYPLSSHSGSPSAPPTYPSAGSRTTHSWTS